eukprot:1000287-Amorphochlora_amoeboformis.AAC.1
MNMCVTQIYIYHTHLTNALKHKQHTQAEEIEGFFFARLKERRPELSDKLDVLRGDLLAKVEEDASKVQVWDMQDLGVQAVGRILRAQ